MLGMTSSCCREKADICSYLQSFFLLPAEQPLLPGEHLAVSPTVGLPGQRSITETVQSLLLPPPRGTAQETSPKGESSGHQAPLEVPGPAVTLNKEAVCQVRAAGTASQVPWRVSGELCPGQPRKGLSGITTRLGSIDLNHGLCH